MPARKLRMLVVSLWLAAALVVCASLVMAASNDESQGTLAKLRTEAAVRLALLGSLGADGLRIGIDVVGDTVILSGEVKKRSSQELAKEVALGVDGVTAVKNNLRHRDDEDGGPVSGAVADLEGEVADAALESRVKLALFDQVGKAALDVEVEATDRVVSLRGNVADARQRSLAVDAAKQTAGVERVIDLLSSS